MSFSKTLIFIIDAAKVFLNSRLHQWRKNEELLGFFPAWNSLDRTGSHLLMQKMYLAGST